MAAKPTDFDKLLIGSIDEALFSLGESAQQSIYFHLEKNFLVSREEIPQNLENFQCALEKIFGVGARFLEILIMKNLFSKIGCPLRIEKNEPLEFIKYVNSARQSFNGDRRN